MDKIPAKKSISIELITLLHWVVASKLEIGSPETC